MTPKELITVLENKGLTAGSYCTYKRTYSQNSSVYYIGKLKILGSSPHIFITNFIQVQEITNPHTSTLKLNYGNIQFISKATFAEKSLYKLLKNP